MRDLRKAAEELIEAWDWDCSEPRNKVLRDLIEDLRQALAQPEQEPVLWMMPDGKTVDKWGLQFYGGVTGKPLYTASPKREWVGLTEEEIDLYALDIGVTANKAPAWLVVYAKDIEAKLKEKNT